MSVAESALGAVARIGPYFSVVSLVPSAAFVGGSYLLLRSAPWTGSPNWAGPLEDFRTMSWQLLLLGVVATSLVAFLLHPLQFTHVQLMEGYWGNSPVAVLIGTAAIRGHYADLLQTIQKEQRSRTALEDLGPGAFADRAATTYEADAHRKKRGDYPEQFEDLMPTQLGNVLRRYERSAGFPYGLDAITVLPLIAAVAPEGQMRYLDDQRTQLDLAARFSTVFLLLSIESLVLLPSGWWVLLGAAAYAMSWAFYKGAVQQAHLYGNAISSLIDLNRFQFYESLRVAVPTSVDLERQQNEQLQSQLGERSSTFNYPFSKVRGAAKSD